MTKHMLTMLISDLSRVAECRVNRAIFHRWTFTWVGPKSHPGICGDCVVEVMMEAA